MQVKFYPKGEPGDLGVRSKDQILDLEKTI